MKRKTRIAIKSFYNS